MRVLVNCACSRWDAKRGWYGNPDCWLGCNGSGVQTIEEPERSKCDCPASLQYAEPPQHSVGCHEFKHPALPPEPDEAPAADPVSVGGGEPRIYPAGGPRAEGPAPLARR